MQLFVSEINFFNLFISPDQYSPTANRFFPACLRIFFNQSSKKKERILPVFYSDNYCSVMPGAEKKIIIEYTASQNAATPMIGVEGWNVTEQEVMVQ